MICIGNQPIPGRQPPLAEQVYGRIVLYMTRYYLNTILPDISVAFDDTKGVLKARAQRLVANFPALRPFRSVRDFKAKTSQGSAGTDQSKLRRPNKSRPHFNSYSNCLVNHKNEFSSMFFMIHRVRRVTVGGGRSGVHAIRSLQKSRSILYIK